jgi:hypothetical protein
LCDADVVFERGKINQEYYFYFLKRLVQQRWRRINFFFHYLVFLRTGQQRRKFSTDTDNLFTRKNPTLTSDSKSISVIFCCHKQRDFTIALKAGNFVKAPDSPIEESLKQYRMSSRLGKCFWIVIE